MCVHVYLRGHVAHRQLVWLADLTAPSCVFVQRETSLQCVNKEAFWNKLPVHSRYCHAEFYAVSAQITEVSHAQLSVVCIKTHFWYRSTILTVPERGKGSDTTISYSSRRKVKMSVRDTCAHFKHQIFGRLHPTISVIFRNQQSDLWTHFRQRLAWRSWSKPLNNNKVFYRRAP